MTLHEFVSLVARGGEGGNTFVAVQRKDGFVGYSGEIWCNNAIGFSWCTRKGYALGEDWGKGKVKVKGITTVYMYDQYVPCAIID